MFRADILSHDLVNWYQSNRRDLPWRKSRDAYRIWISEVMLQQTTVAAVLPYYERFMVRFPSVKDLAKAPLEEVFVLWAGLGYYSRARNLHKAAQILSQQGFPKSAEELEELPGLGPYTARAVASIAFGESVGVLDGNVIRVLSRVTGTAFEHWKTQGRKDLQGLADRLAASGDPSAVNQGLMELGATVCTTQRPQCLLCPWSARCEARKHSRIEELPLRKPRRDPEFWVWNPLILRRGKKVALMKNNYAPFLRNQWIFPGTLQTSRKRPKKFDLEHFITHHEIYIRIAPPAETATKGLKWVPTSELSKWNPSSLLRKVLDCSVTAS